MTDARRPDILDTALRLGAKLRRSAGEYVGPCIVCGGRDRFSINTKKQLFNCRGCGQGGDAIDLVRHLTGASFVEAVKQLGGELPENPAKRHKKVPISKSVTAENPAPALPSGERDHAASVQRIVARLVPILGSPGEQYLCESRRIDTSPIRDILERTDAMGWHPGVFFNEPGHALHRQLIGAIVGVMTDPVTALPTGAISRTYLDPDGRKLGKARTLGSPAGIIRLSPDDEVTSGLHLAEGIESALSAAALDFGPIWATGGKGLMATFPVLSGIAALTIFADNDKNGAGGKAAGWTGARWRAAGREVRIFMRDDPGDINDAIKEADGGLEP